jgi:hypothetical protein
MNQTFYNRVYMPRLTPQELQVVQRCLEKDEHLLEKYCFLLFEDKRVVELAWNGKKPFNGV